MTRDGQLEFCLLSLQFLLDCLYMCMYFRKLLLYKLSILSLKLSLIFTAYPHMPHHVPLSPLPHLILHSSLPIHA